MNHVKGAANKKDALWSSRVKPLVDNHVKPILGIRRGERGVAAGAAPDRAADVVARGAQADH